MISPFSIASRKGSSPLARGLPRRRPRPLRQPRIIPARAGFTPRPSSGGSPPGDHPRSRGVYTADGSSPDSRRGSSPLARGLHGHPGDGDGGARIIPARAGFTSAATSAAAPAADHPRSRGVYMRWPAHDRSSMGSSPLARGLRIEAFQRYLNTGIIPARAGFTTRFLVLRTWLWDHPRSRGVYCAPLLGISKRSGSSPLARGLPVRPLEAVTGQGIIPARAGFTSWRPGGRRRGADHPRSRGVYIMFRLVFEIIKGSSPLARGLP